MKIIIIGLIITLLSFNFAFAESGWAQDLKWYELLALISFYLIINPITWIVISIIIGFIIYKIIKKRKSRIENIKKQIRNK